MVEKQVSNSGVGGTYMITQTGFGKENIQFHVYLLGAWTETDLAT